MDNEAPELRFLERLCGYGVYYYRRFVNSNDKRGVENLTSDLHEWYREAFVDNSLVRFNGDVGKYWSFVGDIKRGSKLPKLAAVILSIAVNTATCERYFSKLAAIHTALKNRMSAEKARKLSLIRQGIRSLANAENDEKQHVELKRIVVASERKRVGNCDTAPPVTIDKLEENHLIQLQEMPDADTP
ncbi:hypothetical protein PHYPSEUDO_002221 [Phytophthora pseudosyringae]|uniref:HAT C-terminal dimerisation domain-containing protein n=1 Tax=Phytophthora pseudosyringae TaxID=221518 RepID=A0A8T1VWZ3_9STRA|nr:hypothetical protein PHYPSEUDO_002221 [Phytophthora pseudosyringae]